METFPRDKGAIMAVARVPYWFVLCGAPVT